MTTQTTRHDFIRDLIDDARARQDPAYAESVYDEMRLILRVDAEGRTHLDMHGHWHAIPSMLGVSLCADGNGVAFRRVCQNLRQIDRTGTLNPPDEPMTLALTIQDGIPVSRFEGVTAESLLYALIGVTIETPEQTDLSHKLLTVLARCEEQTRWLDDNVTFAPVIH